MAKGSRGVRTGRSLCNRLPKIHVGLDFSAGRNLMLVEGDTTLWEEVGTFEISEGSQEGAS